MIRNLWTIGAILGLTLGALRVAAQADDDRLSYGETVRGELVGEGDAQEWRFTGRRLEMVAVEVSRLSGMFLPTVELLDGQGRRLEPKPWPADARPIDRQRQVYDQGLPADGDYVLRVTGSNILNDVDNPDQYRLTLTRLGVRKADPQENLVIPDIGLGGNVPPPLEQGAPLPNEGNVAQLRLAVYGNVRVTRPDPGRRPAFFTLSGSRDIRDLYGGNVLSRVIRSISFVADGIGMTSASGEAIFFTDSDVRFMENDASTLRFQLDSGQVVITDFHRIRILMAVDGIVAAVMTTGQRVLLSGEYIALLKGQRDEFNQFIIDDRLDSPELRGTNNSQDDQIIVTDLAAWDTLALLPQGGRALLSVLYGSDFRILSDLARLRLTRPIPDAFKNNPQDAPLIYSAQWEVVPNQMLQMDIDPRGLGDVILQDQLLRVLPLDGRQIEEPYANIANLTTEDGGLRFTRRDGSSRLSLPDGTDIQTPASLPPLGGAVGRVGFAPHALSQLTNGFASSCPCITSAEPVVPIEVSSGAFFYAVTDFHVPSHTLALNFARFYNSRTGQLTPDYLLSAPTPPIYGQLGAGWRHNFQYELDIRYAPLGEVRLVTPDGVIHAYRPDGNIPNRFVSLTAPHWLLQRLSGTMGAWRITSTDGLRYEFDRAGRLLDIRDRQGRGLSFAPLPRQDASGQEVRGFFVTETYGRRLEVYQDSAGRVLRVVSADKAQARYRYDADGQLIGVTYADDAQVAEYSYQGGRIVRISDPYSLLHDQLAIGYDAEGRVVQFSENPDGNPSRVYGFVYERGRVTLTLLADGQPRVTTYTLDGLQRVQRVELPKPGWFISYEYDPASGLPSAYRTPEGSFMRFNFNKQGLLIQFRDPNYTDSGAGKLEYAPFPGPDGKPLDGHQQLLTAITYNNNTDYDQFRYDELGRLVEWRTPVSRQGNTTIERLTRYEYDSLGRLVRLIEPGPNGEDVATVYSYDKFGYVTRVEEGVVDGQAAHRLDFTYDLVGRLRGVVDGRGSSFRLNWNERRNELTRIEAPLGYVITFAYDERGNLVERNEAGQVTRVEYDQLNYVTRLIDALGRVTDFRRDALGNLTEMILPDGKSVWRYTYDELNFLASVTSPGGRRTRYETTLRDNGRLWRDEIDPSGQRTRSIYNALGWLTDLEVYDRSDRPTYLYLIDYNPFTRQVTVTERHVPQGRRLTLDYDLLGRPVSSAINQLKTSYTYDSAGNLASVTNSAGRTIRYNYDVLGNLLEVNLPGDATTPEGTIRYSYDENGNLLSMIDPGGGQTTYVYDALNRLTSTTDASGQQTTYEYDLRGNLLSITDPLRNRRSASYDALDRVIAILDALGEETRYDYDVLGRLREIERPRGLFARYTYDLNDNIVALTQPNNRTVLYGYDAQGRVISQTDALGRTTVYTYNRLDRLASIVNPLGFSQQFNWSASGRLRQYIDQMNRVYDYNTDDVGRLTQVRDATTVQNLAINLRYSYSPVGDVLDISFGTVNTLGSARDISYTYEYNVRGQVRSATDAEGKKWTLDYDASGRVIRQTDPLGVATEYSYDANGRVIELREGVRNGRAARVTRYERDAIGQVVRMIAADGTTTDYTYDANGRVTALRVTDAQGRSWETFYAYDALGYLTQVTDPLGRNTRYAYDEFGNLLRSVRLLEGENGACPDIPRTAYRQREASGCDVEIVTSYTYDNVNNLVSIRSPMRQGIEDEEDIIMSYNALNQRVRYVNAESKVYAYVYDRNGKLLQISDPLGSVTEYEYDTMDRVTSITYPNGAVVRFSYTEIGGLDKVTSPDTETRTFQGGRETVKQENAVITYEIDRNGNLRSITDADRSKTIFRVDDVGRTVERINANGQTTRYGYDVLGNLTDIIYPTGSIRREYDAQGRLLSVQAQEGSYSYTYDGLGRLLSMSGPNGLRVRYTVDEVGNVLEVDAGEFGKWRYEYDSLYRVVKVGDGQREISFRYDRNGNRLAIIRSNGVTTETSYNGSGAPTRLTHLGPEGALDSLFYSYDDVGNIVRLTRGDGYNVLYSYDQAHQAIDERWLNSSNQIQYATSVRYDAIGNRVEQLVTDAEGIPSRTLYVYDRENQLIQEIRNYVAPDLSSLSLPLLLGWGVALWMARHQRRARRTLVGLAAFALILGLGWQAVQAQDQERYTVNYAYDAQGNLTQITHVLERGRERVQLSQLTMAYDAENRLVSVDGAREDGAKVSLRYSYNAFGRLWRYDETVNGSGSRRFQFIYERDRLIAMRDEGSGQVTRFLEAFPGERLLVINADGTEEWPLYDALGSKRRTVDGQGRPVSDDPNLGYDYNVFGEQIAPYGSASRRGAVRPMDRLFVGQPYDINSGLYLMGMRAYHPPTGRFWQRDPIRHDPRATLYTYAYNRPVVYVDPTGMTPERAIRATMAIDMPRLALPDNQPPPLLQRVPPPPVISLLQAQEDFRVLALTYHLLANVNEVRMSFDPYGRSFYMYRANPMPDAARQAMMSEALAVTRAFSAGQGWAGPPPPSPEDRPPVLAILGRVDSLLLPTLGDMGGLCLPALSSALNLPQFGDMTRLPLRNQLETGLSDFFYEVPIMPAAYEATLKLLDTARLLPTLGLQDAPVPAQNIAINPVILRHIDDLRAAQRNFYERVLGR